MSGSQGSGAAGRAFPPTVPVLFPGLREAHCTWPLAMLSCPADR